MKDLRSVKLRWAHGAGMAGRRAGVSLGPPALTFRLLARASYVRSVRGHGTYVANTPPSELIQRFIHALETGKAISSDDAAPLATLLRTLLAPDA